MTRSIFLIVLFTVVPAALLAQNPPIPSNLTAENMSGNTVGVMLNWQAPGQWTYKIYRSLGDSSHFLSIGWAPMPSFQDHQVLILNTYYYYVTSLTFRDGLLIESPRSNIAQVTVNTSRPHGRVSGSVIADMNSQPIANVTIRVFRLNLQPCWSPPTITNSSGQYAVELDTGSYFIRADPPWESQYHSEWYNNAPEPSSATPVRVTASSNIIANFSLASLNPSTTVTINGVVRRTDGLPVSGASVVFMRTMQEMNYLAATTGQIPGLGNEARMIPGLGYTRGVIWMGQTEPGGQFHARVPAGMSCIAAAGKSGYLPEYFNNRSDPTLADIITAVHDTSGINFSLSEYPEEENNVRGTVRDSTGEPVPSRVILFPKPPGTQPPSLTRFVHSDTLGNYEFSHVVGATYSVLAVPYSNFASAFYKQNSYGVIHWQDADSIIVEDSLANINVGLVPVLSPGLTQVTGTITSTNGGAIAGSRLVARTTTGTTVGYGISDGQGRYSVDAVPAGQVTVYVDRTGYSATEGTIIIPTNTYTINSFFVLGGNTPASAELQPVQPHSFELEQNYPNPFNPTTTIRFTLTLQSKVVLKVFNILGREVATLLDGDRDAGSVTVDFDGSRLASGLYFYRLEARPVDGGKGERFVETRKTLLLK